MDTPNTIGCLKPFQQYQMVQSVKKQHSDQEEPPGKLVCHRCYKAEHQGHSIRQSLCYGFACKQTERFQGGCCQTDGFLTQSGQLSQNSLR